MINGTTLTNSNGAVHPAGDGSSEITQQSFQILKEARAIQHEKRRQLMHMEQMLPKAEKTLTEIEMLLVIIGVMLIAMLALKFIQLISELYVIKPTRHPVHVMPAETPNPPCTIVP
ncbi:hypothetical protein Ddc_13130 [Ditylenchus destructor]|nr:hypothetical protein Ddc_13130 [Ditylenchus destructor]